MAARKPRSKSKTKTEGAVKGGNGKYQFKLSEVRDTPAGPKLVRSG